MIVRRDRAPTVKRTAAASEARSAESSERSEPHEARSAEAPEPRSGEPTEARSAEANRWQWGSLAAALAGIFIVMLVTVLDGGVLSSLIQAPAALIVIGGTIAATLVSYSPRAAWSAVRSARDAFRGDDANLEELSANLVALAIRAHRGGLLALDSEITRVRDPFLRNGLTLVVDGASRELLRDALRAERLAEEARDDIPARIFESAAGYAPTLGILGAVIGLMRVMETLGNPAAVGTGIATAFVATIYGVGTANLLLLPIAARLRERATTRSQRRAVVAEALFDVQSRLNPRMVAHKTKSFATRLPAIEEIARRVFTNGYAISPVPE